MLALKRERLVLIDPQRATSIFHIDKTEIESIRAFRELLEEQAARNAFAGDRVAFARSIGAVLDKMNAALESGGRTEYRALDAELHDVILSYGYNPYLTAAYNRIATSPLQDRCRGHLSKITADPGIWQSVRRIPGATVAPTVRALSP